MSSVFGVPLLEVTDAEDDYERVYLDLATSKISSEKLTQMECYSNDPNNDLTETNHSDNTETIQLNKNTQIEDDCTATIPLSENVNIVSEVSIETEEYPIDTVDTNFSQKTRRSMGGTRAKQGTNRLSDVPKKNLKKSKRRNEGTWELLDLGINTQTAWNLLTERKNDIKVGSFLIRYKDIKKSDYETYLWCVVNDKELRKYKFECDSECGLKGFVRTTETTIWSRIESCWFHRLYKEVVGVTENYERLFIKYPPLDHLQTVADKVEQVFFHSIQAGYNPRYLSCLDSHRQTAMYSSVDHKNLPSYFDDLLHPPISHITYQSPNDTEDSLHMQNGYAMLKEYDLQPAFVNVSDTSNSVHYIANASSNGHPIVIDFYECDPELIEEFFS